MTQANNVGILTPKINASGQLDVTTGVTGTLPVANGGTGAATLTSANVILGAGTSAVTFVAPGSNGNVLTSNGSTWTSAAPAGGGVSSLNGQTGAVVNTTLYAIGSYVVGRIAPTNRSNNTSAVDATLAGTSLTNVSVGAGWLFDGEGGSTAGVSAIGVFGAGTGVSAGLVNTGSWRCLSPAGHGPQAGTNGGQQVPGLWVRYA
jgi:hypothetical protein